MSGWRAWLLPKLLRATTAAVLLGVAAVAFVVGALADPRRAAWAYLAAYISVLGTVLAMLLLVMTVELSGGRWLGGLRRQAEAVIGTLPLLALLFVPVVLGAHALYVWTTPDALPAPLRARVDARRPYLAPGFALARAAAYWAVWIALGESVRSSSLRRDLTGDERCTRRMRVLSALGIPLLALTLTLASVDWLMSLSPEWSSSITGVYVYAGGSVGALALLALGGGVVRHRGGANGITEDDLGAVAALLLAFVLFWAYLGYSQFLIVWSADLPREVPWYAARTRGVWGAVALALVLGHVALPLVALLPSAVRRSAAAVAAVGAWMLVMHWVDVWWLVVPARANGQEGPHWLDPVALVLVAGLALVAGAWRYTRFRSIRVPARVSRATADAAPAGAVPR